MLRNILFGLMMSMCFSVHAGLIYQVSKDCNSYLKGMYVELDNSPPLVPLPPNHIAVLTPGGASGAVPSKCIQAKLETNSPALAAKEMENLGVVAFDADHPLGDENRGLDPQLGTPSTL